LKKSKTRALLIFCSWFIGFAVQGGFGRSVSAQTAHMEQDTVHRLEHQQLPVAQEAETGGFFDKIVDALTPRIWQNVHRLRQYIRTEEYAAKRKAFGELYAVDDIFRKAIDLEERCVQDALLVSALAVMDHKRLDIHVLFGITIPIPLTFESDTLYDARLKNLPAHIYPDSPLEWAGDKDKLQHLFGSAYLTYLFRSRGIANFVGIIVEGGETVARLDGAGDHRDLRTNRHGRDFGMALLKFPVAKPSDVIRYETLAEDLLLTIVK
jgi:hypothetical protein